MLGMILSQYRQLVSTTVVRAQACQDHYIAVPGTVYPVFLLSGSDHPRNPKINTEIIKWELRNANFKTTENS